MYVQYCSVISLQSFAIVQQFRCGIKCIVLCDTSYVCDYAMFYTAAAYNVTIHTFVFYTTHVHPICWVVIISLAT